MITARGKRSDSIFFGSVIQNQRFKITLLFVLLINIGLLTIVDIFHFTITEMWLSDNQPVQFEIQ